MNHPARQLADPGAFSPLRVVAVLGLEPADFEALGVRFTDDEDDLGALRWALLVAERHHVLLSRHRHAPEPGAEIHVPENEDAAAALRAFLRLFSLSPDAVTWLAPDIPERAIVTT
jgi:hypothetical protein